MQKSNIEKIQDIVEHAKGIKTAMLEYNFEELPRHKEINNDSFYGVPAKFNKDVSKESVVLTYKY